MPKTIVLYPALAVSHFVPMMQFADHLLEEGYAVTVALMDPSLKGDIALAAVVDRIASSKPLVTFHKLPLIQDPPTIIHDKKFLTRYFDLVNRYSQHLHDFLCSMPPCSVHALIMDVMSVVVLDAIKKLGIPTYSFSPANASSLAIFSQLPLICRDGQPSIKGMGDSLLNFRGVPPTKASYIISDTVDFEDPESEKMLMDALCKKPIETDGVLLNTFLTLEARAVGALRDKQCLPPMPPVYCVGPLVAEAGLTDEKHECLSWLDKQPESSVVYLCFGSVGAGNHSEEQLKEMAIGLEKSGHRFLWVVRAPPGNDPEMPVDPRADPDLDVILPEGFLERTHGRGLVVKLWAPQVEVLRHKATGAFVTHCGWNSVLEGIMAGVPMLCWPLYAEQKMNQVFMVEEARIGVEMVGWQQGLVKAEELEAKVKLVMDSEEGEHLRLRVMAQSEAAAMAWKNNGSSRLAFDQFLSDAGNLGHGPVCL